MATLQNNYRQYPLAAEQLLEVDDLLPAGLSTIKIELPPGAILLSGGVLVITPFNATGAGLLDVGLEGGAANALLNDADIETAGFTAFSAGAGTYFPNGGAITFTGVATTGATAGALRVIAQYIVVDRGNEVQ
jgi:hypothetical protein